MSRQIWRADRGKPLVSAGDIRPLGRAKPALLGRRAPQVRQFASSGADRPCHGPVRRDGTRYATCEVIHGLVKIYLHSEI
jgi:hypothetical protein